MEQIEHRLFSHITMNRRGRPLTSHDVIVHSIATATTRTGLAVRAELDTAVYETGARVSDGQMNALPLDRHDWHGDWNYTWPQPGRPRGKKISTGDAAATGRKSPPQASTPAGAPASPSSTGS